MSTAHVLRLTSYTIDASGQVFLTFLWNGVETVHTYTSELNMATAGKTLCESAADCAKVIASYGVKADGVTIDFSRAMSKDLRVEKSEPAVISILEPHPTFGWRAALL